MEAQKSDTNLSSSPRSPGLRSLNVKELNKSRAKDIEEKEKKSRENSKPARENFSGGIQNFFTKLTVSKDTTSSKLAICDISTSYLYLYIFREERR